MTVHPLQDPLSRTLLSVLILCVSLKRDACCFFMLVIRLVNENQRKSDETIIIFHTLRNRIA
jgi:hypothetical protein